MKHPLKHMTRSFALLLYLTCFTSFLLPLLAGCEQNAPVKVYLGTNAAWGTPQIQITALEGPITIKSYQYNQGQCTGTPQAALPVQLQQGGMLKIEASRCNPLKEVMLETNRGKFVFTF